MGGMGACGWILAHLFYVRDDYSALTSLVVDRWPCVIDISVSTGDDDEGE
jgi:hypothetical protein